MRKGWMRAALAFGVSGAAVAVMAGSAYATTVSAANDSATTTAGKAVAIDVAANDTIDDGAKTVTVSVPATTAHGGNTASGTTVTYTPNAGYTGTDAFQYEICATFDGGYGGGDTKDCDTATVTVTIGADTSNQGTGDNYGAGDVSNEGTGTNTGAGTGTTGSGGSTLPHTGAGDAPLALLAFALLAGGFACYVAARDRTRAVVR